MLNTAPFFVYKPEKVFTEEGLEAYKHHLYNLKKAIQFIVNHNDDLSIASVSRQGCEAQDTLFAMKKLLDSKFLEEGDYEEE